MTSKMRCLKILIITVMAVMKNFEVGAPQSDAGCQLTEFSCSNGNCISLNKFCDGRDDCGNGNDEPPGCSVCNKTFHGYIKIKYPLRIIEPPQRHLPFFCKITFMASGGQLGKIVEIKFLSFTIGTLQQTDGGASCYGGYLQILDNNDKGNKCAREGYITSVPNLKQLNKCDLHVPEEDWQGSGYFCGQMIGQNVNYFSRGNNVTLVISLPSRASWRPQSFSLYLTYKFVTRSTLTSETGRGSQFFGKKETATFCNRQYKNCVAKRCLIRSPNFPGTYPRNITCNYLIKEDNLVPGFQNQIILSQKNKYKISIESGLSSSGAISRWSLTSDCPHDVVRVFDGPTVYFPVIAKFCGSGPLAAIVSSSGTLLIQLHSVDYHRLHESRLEIEVGVKTVPKPLWRMSNNECIFFIDGSVSGKRQGILQTPQHTIPSNTTCTYILRGRSSYDRVWIYFVSYFIKDKHPWPVSSEFCDTGKIEMIGVTKRASSADSVNITYCEKNPPPLCARASDGVNMIPFRPCRYPEESMLSSHSNLLIKIHYPSTAEFTTDQPTLKARYEFIDTYQPGSPFGQSLCSRYIDGQSFLYGSLFSSKNVFHFGRGGRGHITCSYTLVGSKLSRIIISMSKVFMLSSSCQTVVDSSTLRPTCRELDPSTQLKAYFKVSENWYGVDFPIVCFCSMKTDKNNSIVVSSASNNVTITFSVMGMNALHDFNHFHFEAFYRFIHFNVCESVLIRRNGSRGELLFQVPHVLPGGFRCRWSIEPSYSKNLYLTFPGTNASNGCYRGNVLVAYKTNSETRIATVCVNESAEVFSIDPWCDQRSKHETTFGFKQKDRIFIEAFINYPQSIHVEWLEVTKHSLKTSSGQSLRNINCLVRCPEINACISPELWCDGTKHCPSGYDESSEHCRQFPVFYFAAGGGATCFLLILLIGHVLVRYHHRDRNNHIIRVPTFDVFELEVCPGDIPDRLSRY
ncbi:uncharacterized protein LOC143238855 [Tachypleus tridentatus]|uniref:uncharacterized protein LOC143238855 n=1 Tax=Tachypleus tridentatus TaxID=6853 RepID=UPI003FD00A6A